MKALIDSKRSASDFIIPYTLAALWAGVNLWWYLHIHSRHPYRAAFVVLLWMIVWNEISDYFWSRKKRILKAVNSRLDRGQNA